MSLSRGSHAELKSIGGNVHLAAGHVDALDRCHPIIQFETVSWEVNDIFMDTWLHLPAGLIEDETTNSPMLWKKCTM